MSAIKWQKTGDLFISLPIINPFIWFNLILLWLFVQSSKKKLNREDKISHHSYLLSMVLPALKKIVDEQRREVEIEADIRGMGQHVWLSYRRL